MKPIIFDNTALVALFDGHRRVYATWARAEETSWPLLLPSAAVFAANRELQASEKAWDFVALTPNVVMLDLTGSGALRASDFGDDLAVAQVSLEASVTLGTIITSRPEAYGPMLRTWSF